MERVKNILQKLQEVYYSKHQKSAIDVDLMLDYTRVMYADLLEWRHTFKEEPLTTERAEPNKTIVSSEAEKQSSVTELAAPSAGDTAAETTTVTEHKEEKLQSIPQEAEKEPEPKAQQPVDKAYQPVQHDEPVPKEPVSEMETEPVVTTEPEQEYIDILQKDASGISFEPPSAPETRSEIKEELLIEEPAVQQVVEEKPAPPPVAIPLPDMAPVAPAQEQKPAQPANLFSTVKMPKDIRNAIGINDKYLFLNELFNNHKSNYEEALDKLNHFSTVDQAEDWIRTKIAPAHKWDKEDATVESFYTIVRRYFSER